MSCRTRIINLWRAIERTMICTTKIHRKATKLNYLCFEYALGFTITKSLSQEILIGSNVKCQVC